MNVDEGPKLLRMVEWLNEGMAESEEVSRIAGRGVPGSQKGFRAKPRRTQAAKKKGTTDSNL
jgi:hypothetical protein